MELNKCPNCSGKLEIAPNRKRLICAYCGSEFPLDETTKQEIGDQPVNKDWFIYDWNYEKVMANPDCNTVITAFVRGLNEYETSNKLETYIRDYLMNFEEASAEGIREDKMRGIVQRFAGSFLPGERVIIYNDDGIFVRGKTGTLVTTKRTFFIEKKAHKEIMHTAVPYINIGYSDHKELGPGEIVHTAIPYINFGYSVGLPEVKLGEKYANNIGTFNSHFDLMGSMAALIVKLAFEQKPDRPKIRLTDTLK